jgi:phage protein D
MTSTIATETFRIEIDGEEIDDVYDRLARVEVELDDALPGMWRIRIPLLLEKDGVWSLLDDERFRLWKPVAISAGFGGDAQELIRGYVTHMRPTFEPDPAQCIFDVWGLDGSVAMDREDRLKDWPNKKDSDIAAELFTQYGFTAEVDDTEVIHDEEVSTIVQRETDWQFLNRLSARNGFECFVDGTTGFFRKPDTNAEPQAILAAHFGDETNVNRIRLEANALTPANAAITQLDRTTKELLDVTADSSDDASLGTMSAAAVIAAGAGPARVAIAQTVSTGSAEMTAIARGLFERQQWFVAGEGEVAANLAAVMLKPRGTVTIKGIGETFSGVYAVSHVTHSFAGDGYTQTFEVKRNALLPTGAEDFSGGAGGLLGGLA